MAQDDKDGIDRRGALECMIWAGTGVLWTMAGGVPRSSSLLGISAGECPGRERIQLPPDLGQPHRLQGAGQSEPAGDPRRGHRQDRRAAEEAGLHDPHRRHHPPLQARGIRQCRPGDRQGAARHLLRPRRARHHRRGSRQGLSGALRQAGPGQGHRLVFLRPERRAFRRPRQRRGPQGRRHGRARRGATRLARRRSEGRRRLPPPSCCSPTSRCGP